MAGQIKWRGVSYNSKQGQRSFNYRNNDIDLVGWFTNAYVAYQKGIPMLPSPPFELGDGIQVVSESFYESLQRRIERNDLSASLFDTLDKLFTVSLAKK
jgi:hypothetical protein